MVYFCKETNQKGSMVNIPMQRKQQMVKLEKRTAIIRNNAGIISSKKYAIGDNQYENKINL